MRASSPPVPGEVIAQRYRIEELLGEGGMGQVYRATHLRLGRSVAVKVLQPVVADRAGARARFEREARVASLLRHPNAVAIHDFGDDSGRLYIAMDLVPGACLRAVVDEHLPPLSITRASAIARQIADVLAVAEDLELVHRDLKPENVFLEDPGGRDHVVVVDFGLAFVGGSEELGRLTRDGVPTGTPAYASPEQARGGAIGPPTDVYALGCLLFEMLTTRAPFGGPHADLMAAHLFRHPPALREVLPEVGFPGALEELVARMLAKDPALRPTARAVGDALDRLDAHAPLRKGRGAHAPQLAGRGARMISLPSTQPLATPVPAVREGVAAVWGTISDETVTALAALGLATRTIDEPAAAAGADVVLALGRSLEELASLVAIGVPVVADTPPQDVERLAALLRTGIADAVTSPLEPSRVAAKLHRARRRSQRGDP